MADCIFCKIIQGQIPSRKVYEDDEVLAFHDVSPQAPAHILVIPKKHVEQLAGLHADDAEWLGRLLVRLASIAESEELTDYRVVVNNGASAGQSVFHLHLHLLGGRAMRWPPG